MTESKRLTTVYKRKLKEITKEQMQVIPVLESSRIIPQGVKTLIKRHYEDAKDACKARIFAEQEGLQNG